MTSISSQSEPLERLLSRSAELNRAETGETAVECATKMAEVAFDQPAVSVYECDAHAETVTTIEPSGSSSSPTRGVADATRESVLSCAREYEDDQPPTVDTDPRGSFQAAVLAPVGRDRVLHLRVTDPDGVDRADVAVVEGIAANLEATLARVDSQRPASGESGSPDDGDATALRRLNELAVDAGEFDDTVERLLSLGCDHFGLETGILSHVDGDDYEVEAVVDATGTHDVGAVYDLGDTLCAATLAGEVTEPLAFADVAKTDHRDHPAAESVRAYIAAPVVVDGETYGTVNFSMESPRSAAFRPEENAFVKLVAQWVGTEIERRRQFEELERYETILEAVDDPVYALDADGRFTFVNEAAKREFGYGTDIVGERPSVGMDDSDVERIRGQVEDLLATDDRSTTAEFELETADGARKTVENRLGLIDDDEFRGTAGVLRDITARRQRRRQLEAFQRAVDEAADGIAILDDEEYTHVDQSHVDMYGFEDRDQLLGNTWRKLYDDEEIERLEQEAFPALEEEGYWRGMVTGSRPDGSTFPAELSLTIIEDGRLVCAVRDVTERRERERQKEATIDALEQLYQVTTDSSLSFEEKVDGLLATGSEYLDLPYGFLTRIETGDERQGTQRIIEARGSHELLQPGESCPLPKSYCRRTIQNSDLSVITDAAGDGWVGDPAYETFGLETYIAGSVSADATTYGTLCFASREPRTEEFTQTEQSFVNLVRRWVSYELDRRSTYTELSQQRERLELTLSGTNTGLAEWNLETDAVTHNETLVELLGRDVESIDEFEAAVHPDDRDRVRASIESILDTVGPFVSEFRMLDGEGDVTWVKTKAIAASDDGETDRVLATVTDITERKREERERRRNEYRFESLFEDPTMLIGLLDTDGTVLGVNGTALEYVAATAEDVRGERFWETPWWDHSEDLQADLQAWVRRAADGEYVNYEATHPGPDGDTHHVTGTVRPVTGESGSVESLLVSGRDVTELKEREASLRESEQRYRSLAENIPNGAVLTFDADLEYGLAAGELLSAFGLEPGDVSGMSAGTVLPDADVGDDLVSRFRAALDGERTDRRVGLGDRTLRIQIVPVDSGDGQSAETTGLVLAQDVTEEAQREQALFEERERFRLLIESIDEYAFLVVDEEGAIQAWNHSAESMFGYDAETAVGMSMAELHPGADRESGLPGRLLQQAQIAGESAHEGWRVRADGSEFYADVRHAPLEADDGEFRGYATVVRDMTDRRRQQRRTERFVEESDDVVTVVDTDGTITYASGSADRVLGHDPDDLVGENLFDHVHPDGREKAMETFFTGLEDPDANVNTECRIRSGDGEWRNVEGQCRNMLDDGAIDGMLLYLRDVTENRRRERRFESIFNGTFQFTGLLEPDGTVVEVNDAALQFGGVARDAIVGDPFFDAPWWTHSEDVRDDVRDAIDQAAGGEFVRYETAVRGAGGLATIDFSVKPVTDEDDDVSLLVVEGRDITAREQHRRHLAVMQRVMRHNMRNDLTKMRGWTQVMCEEDEADKRAEQFETVERVLDKWEGMTEKMKQIRTVLESQHENPVGREPESLVEDAVAPVREEYADATVVTDLSDTESTRVPATLLDAVRELVVNAAEASVDATVEVELTQTMDGWTEISVRDDGPGMPDMEADVLETGEETPLNHGQGLGLWMVRMVVTQAGGDVSVATTADGTDVRLRLPTERAVERGRPAETTG